MKRLAIVLCILLLCACDAVTVESPPGEPAPLIEGDWDGIWLHEEAAITVRVTEAAQGRIEAAWIDEREGKLTMESIRGQVRQAGEWQFLVMPFAEETGQPVDPPRYLFGRIRNADGRIMLWSPDPEAFRKAVESEHLPGQVDDGEVRLPKSDEPLVAEMIKRGPELFDWEQPLVLIRFRD